MTEHGAPPTTGPTGRPVTVRTAFSDTAHAGAVMLGLQRLEAAGAVRCVWDRSVHSPLGLAAWVDDTFVVLDVRDGLNWVRADEETNLRFFREHAPRGVLLKRSYHPALADATPEGCRVHALGLNLPATPLYRPRHASRQGERGRSSHVSLRQRLGRRLGPHVVEQDYVGYPQLRGEHRVLLHTRLWDPGTRDVEWREAREEREALNDFRIRAVSMCRREFGDRFSGGIVADDFSRQSCDPDLLLPAADTERRAYLHTVKRHAVCIATAGLHGSTGWRFAEYVAGARAIVSERLRFDPGPGIEEGRHYLGFDSLEGLGAAVDRLLSSPDLVREMMHANLVAYRTFCAPEVQVWRAIETALDAARTPGVPA